MPKGFSYTTDADRKGECNDRTDFPEYRQTNLARRCVGTCTPDRQPMTHAQQAMGGADFVAGMIDWGQLGKPRDEDEAAEWSIQRRMAEADRMPSPAVYYGQQALQQSEAIDAERQRLLNGCSEIEQSAARTYQEARQAGWSDTNAMAPMGLGRGERGEVVRLNGRQAEPVRRLR